MSKIMPFMKNLYGENNYHNHFKYNSEYWYGFPDNDEIVLLTGKSLHKLKITNIRSGCIFYVLPEYPSIPEKFVSAKSLMCAFMVPCVLDPINDTNIPSLIEKSKKDCPLLPIPRFIFDDKLTTIVNWDNEKGCPLNENI